MNKARAIVAGHGDFAEGIVSAVRQITGRDDVFIPISNRGLSAQDVERSIRELVASTDAADGDQAPVTVVFTDLPAGSCTMAARRLQRDQPGLAVVTGVNLAALLEFVFNEDDDPAAAASEAVEKGRTALMVTRARGGVPRPTNGAPAAGDSTAGGDRGA